MKNKENGGAGVCLMHIQEIDYVSFFLDAENLVPPFTPHKDQGYRGHFLFS
jgi:hypothetical protein